MSVRRIIMDASRIRISLPGEDVLDSKFNDPANLTPENLVFDSSWQRVEQLVTIKAFAPGRLPPVGGAAQRTFFAEQSNVPYIKRYARNPSHVTDTVATVAADQGTVVTIVYSNGSVYFKAMEDYIIVPDIGVDYFDAVNTADPPFHPQVYGIYLDPWYIPRLEWIFMVFKP